MLFIIINLDWHTLTAAILVPVYLLMLGIVSAYICYITVDENSVLHHGISDLFSTSSCCLRIFILNEIHVSLCPTKIDIQPEMCVLVRCAGIR